MEECGIDIDDNIQCWCGFKSSFHHSSTSRRKDGKITMWYKCRNNHITPIDVNYKNPIQIVKKKTKKEKKNGIKSKKEMPTQQVS